MSSKIVDALGLPKRTADPASGEEGQAYYNTTLKAIRFHDGSSWLTVGTGAGTVADAPIIVDLPAGSANYTFSGLDGNSDGIYELEFGLVLTAATRVALRFNGDSSNTYRSVMGRDYIQSATTAGGLGHDTPSASGLDKIDLMSNVGAGTPTYATGRYTLYVKSGSVRVVTGTGYAYQADYNGPSNGGGAWADTAANINSLTVFPLTGTFSGTIILRKKRGPTTVVATDPPVVTSLPTTGNFDGRKVYLQPDASQPGVKWTMRYDLLAGKWDCLGGPYLDYYESNALTITTTTTPLGAIAYAVPLPGKYEVWMSMQADMGADGSFAYPTIGGTGVTVDKGSAVAFRSAQTETHSERFVVSVATAGQSIVIAGNMNAGNSFRSLTRHLAIRPIRIG